MLQRSGISVVLSKSCVVNVQCFPNPILEFYRIMHEFFRKTERPSLLLWLVHYACLGSLKIWCLLISMMAGGPNHELQCGECFDVKDIEALMILMEDIAAHYKWVLTIIAGLMRCKNR